MKTSLECSPCFIKQAINVAQYLNLADHDKENLIKNIETLISQIDTSLSPPVIAAQVFDLIIKKTGNHGPLKAVKIESNQIAQKLITKLQNNISESKDPLETAARLAIAGRATQTI